MPSSFGYLCRGGGNRFPRFRDSPFLVPRSRDFPFFLPRFRDFHSFRDTRFFIFISEIPRIVDFSSENPRFIILQHLKNQYLSGIYRAPGFTVLIRHTLACNLHHSSLIYTVLILLFIFPIRCGGR